MLLRSCFCDVVDVVDDWGAAADGALHHNLDGERASRARALRALGV